MRTLLLCSLLAVACAGRAERKLPAPAHLSEMARGLLTDKMHNHGNDMSDLLWATLFLDDASVQDIAENIHDAPRFALPQTNDATELNSGLPAEFFALQEELSVRAEALADSARRKDPEAMAAAYGQLTATCVRCHSLYLSSGPASVDELQSESDDNH